MRSKLRALLAVTVVGAALTACSDQPTSVPVVPRVTGFTTDVLPACNFTALRDAVRNYADVSGNDVIFEYIRDMSTDAYGQGMNGLARIADIRANGPKKAGAGATEAAAAVTAFLACMPVGAVQDGFAQNIVAALGPGGLFEVPTTSSSNAIYSRGETGSYFWAAQPDAGEHVLAAQRRPVERVPQPEQGLHPLELLVMAVGVELGLERDVPRIHREECRPRGERDLLVFDGSLPVRRHPGIPQLGQGAAADQRPVGVGRGERILDLLEPGVRHLRGGGGR